MPTPLALHWCVWTSQEKREWGKPGWVVGGLRCAQSCLHACKLQNITAEPSGGHFGRMRARWTHREQEINGGKKPMSFFDFLLSSNSNCAVAWQAALTLLLLSAQPGAGCAPAPPRLQCPA